MQLKAAYFTNGIETLRTSEAMADKVDALLRQLSYFDVDTDIAFLETCDDAAVALVHNIVSRGAPTYASQFVEDILSTTIGKTLKRIADNGTISREIQKQEVKDLVFKALHIIDPRIGSTMERPSDGDPKAQMVYDYLYSGAVPSQGEYIWQLADTGRKYSDVFKFSKNFRRHIDTLAQDFAFINDGCDLSFSAPYNGGNTADSVTFVFDPTSTATSDNVDYITEDKIAELLRSINVAGRVIVKKSDNPYERTEELSYFTQNPYFDIIRDNYSSPLYKTEDGIEALQIALTPLAIARIQKVVLEAINSGALSLDARSWHIGVIERDVPCAFLAFEDLKQHFNKLFVLENNGRKFPLVKLEIFHTEEFANTELNLLYQGSREDVSEFNPLTAYDLLIDISVLRRTTPLDTPPRTIAAKYAVIRSAHSPSADTRLMFNPYMHYDINLAGAPDDDSDDASAEEDDDEGTYNEQEDALLFFLKNIFAKNAFMDGQAATIAQLLNGNNVLHVSAPGTGKSLIMLFAAMMKPAYSFILPPTIAVMRTQFQALRRRKIDIDYYINPVLQNAYDRSMAVKEVTKGRSLITLISPSLIHDPYIRGVFHEIDALGIPLAYIMIDEAQRLSLQTTEYRAYYQDISNIIAKNFSDDNTTALRIGAFSSTMETNIQHEIAEKLKTDLSLIQKPDLSKLDITVREIDMATVGNNENEHYLSQKLKQVEAAKLISADASKAKPTRTIVLSWTPPFDTTSADGEPNRVAGLDTRFYNGDIDEDGTSITNSEASASMKSIVDFCEGDAMVLSGTYSAGVGVNAQNVGRVILMEPPMSLDTFCRLIGRADLSKSPKIDVLLNTAPKDFVGEETVRDDRGNLSTAQNIIATNFDTAASLTRLLDLAPGASKEKTVMHEILDGVMYPERTDRQNIIEAVFNEFNVIIETDTEPMVRPYQLYIYTQGRAKSLGYIDFRSRTLNMPEMQYDRPLAEKIQSFISDIINDNTDDPLAFLASMENESPAEENDGIQTALDAIMEGKKAQVVIPFYNNYFADAANILNQNLGTSVSALSLLHCYSKTDNYNDFEKLLANATDARPRTLEDRRKLEFRNLYSKFRDGKDTLLAVSRLKEIDIIDDYLVNRATGTVTVSLTKHNKDFYRMKLLPILQRNLTKERMLAYMTGIEEEKYLVMEKYTDVLIDFFYSEIYPLYERSAMESSKFFKTILERQKNDTITKQSVVSNLQNYFTSRYKCSFVFGENIAVTNAGSVDKIFGLIENAGSNINSLMNLQETISLDTPENRTPANKIIYGYCRLFTDKAQTAQSRYEAFANISDGLSESRRTKSVKEFIEDVENITEKIAGENLDLKDEAEEVLPLQIHHQWLRWFNSAVLKVPLETAATAN